MITATCKTDQCSHENIAFFILGNPEIVECGGCGKPTNLTDPTDDPPQPERLITE
jgi:hypothetical protein